MLIPPLLLLNLFVVVVMFSIGLRVSGGELLDILRNRERPSPCSSRARRRRAWLSLQS